MELHHPTVLKTGTYFVAGPKASKTAIGNALSIYKEQLYLIDPADRDSSKVEIGDIRDKTFVMVPDSCGLSEISRSI